MSSVRVEKLTKVYGSDVVAVDAIDLEIAEGEFFALLGPSGCGKTTTMRMIAGFEEVTSGDVFLGEGRVNDVPPHRRNTGMVFQSYALFPHYDVFQNVAYGLVMDELYSGGVGQRARSLAALFSRRLIHRNKGLGARVREALEYVDLAEYEDRKISELSGGQQQRVALARALVKQPAVLLMDEPLSNLDKNLRTQMRATIRRIQREFGITTVFVTHDQEEAMGMADRIALMREGRVVQIATPTELYEHPATPWAAAFVGESNIFSADVADRRNGRTVIDLDGARLQVDQDGEERSRVRVLVRPEAVKVVPGDAPPHLADCPSNELRGEVVGVTYLGPIIQYEVEVGGRRFITEEAFTHSSEVFTPGTSVRLCIGPDRLIVLDDDSEEEMAAAEALAEEGSAA
jgi:iron(III) transport system ATP-binding protein